MNSIHQVEENVDEKAVPNLLPLAISVFFTTFTCGWYVYDVYLRNKETETRVQELDEMIDELNARTEVHADSLYEQDQRIREKKDYDESDEIEEGVYQAWKGVYERTNSETNERVFEIQIQILREKISTTRKNQEWVAWDNEQDVSCTVRDFYLGNSNPEFDWTFVSKEGNLFLAETSDTFVNGWDSTIKLKINVKAFDKELLASFVSEESFQDSKTMNKILKECMNEKRIKWSHILVEV